MELWLDHFARANFLRSADTAHDLKTPLNVAVLNLELLRMRLRKIAGEDDETVIACAQAIDTELRRMGRIFDAFFLLSTPPKNEGAPTLVDAGPLAQEAASAAGLELHIDRPAPVCGHESRIRQAYKLFFEGTSKILSDRQATSSVDSAFTVAVAGRPATADFEAAKLFKFYYTDPEGNPDLSLAVARLIVETYGGELSATEERDKVVLRLSYPVGAR